MIEIMNEKNIKDKLSQLKEVYYIPIFLNKKYVIICIILLLRGVNFFINKI